MVGTSKSTNVGTSKTTNVCTSKSTNVCTSKSTNACTSRSTNVGTDANLPSTTGTDTDISETTCTSVSTPLRSLTHVREDLQNVLDMMGESTPRLNINTSSEADNEDSTFTSSFPSSKKTEPPTDTSELRQRSEMMSSTSNPLTSNPLTSNPLSSNPPTYDTSQCTTRGTTNNTSCTNNVTFKEQFYCRCAKCSSATVCTNGFMVDVPVQVPSSRGAPSGRQTETICAFNEQYDNASQTQDARLSRSESPKRRSFLEWIKGSNQEKCRRETCQLYRVNIEDAEEDGSPPRRLVFDMIEGIPKPVTDTAATNTAKRMMEHCAINTRTIQPATSNQSSYCYTNYEDPKRYRDERIGTSKVKRGVRNEGTGTKEVRNEVRHEGTGTKEIRNEVRNEGTGTKEVRHESTGTKEFKPKKCKFFPENNVNNMAKRRQEAKCFDSLGDSRVDFYYFDHGNAQYLHTTDTAPLLYCEVLAEKTEQTTTKFWAEIFTTVHIATSFIMSFFLQFLKFLLYSILRPVMVGSIQLVSDYFVKPFLTTFFNGIVQPFMIFLYNIATSLRDLCDPLAEGLGYFCRAISHVFRAMRLVTVKKNIYQRPSANIYRKPSVMTCTSLP